LNGKLSYRAGRILGMTQDPLARFDAAAALAQRVVAAVRPDQLDDPTPCTGWTVRNVINHMVTGNLMFISIVAGGLPPDRSADHLGDDYLAAFRDAVRRLSGAFVEHDVLANRYRTPVGEGPGALLVSMRFNEMVVHSWDLARATGQSTDFDPDLVAASLASFQAAPVLPRGEGKPFQAEQPVPPDATVADRLAAFMGRAV
jgi:uncharacterized protein (TIGR03086 family)